MKAPKCYRCSGEKEVRHYSTQCPRAINEERLTDAINTPASASPADGSGPGSKLASRGAVVDATPQVDSDRSPAPSRSGASLRVRAGGGRTPNRRRRGDYNAYMREYMKRRRHG